MSFTTWGWDPYLFVNSKGGNEMVPFDLGDSLLMKELGELIYVLRLPIPCHEISLLLSLIL